MRKWTIALLATLMAGAGAAFAQDLGTTDQGYWAGASVGYPGASLHFGVENVVENIAVRANLGYNYVGAGFAAGVDGLYTLPVDLDAPAHLYAGAGVGFGFGDDFDAAIHLLGGGEFRLVETGAPEIGIFGEVGPGFSVSDGDFAFTGRLGVNYHF